MPGFGKRSRLKLDTCHPDLQEILREAIRIYDFSILCGSRNEEEQNELFDTGRSKVKYPHSKHNSDPSRAVDIAPYPIDWNDKERFHELAGIIKAVAYDKGVELKWGGDFKNFFDGPHFELID